MVHAGLSRAVEDEQIVVLTPNLTAQKHAVAGVFVADREAHQLRVEGAHRRKIIGEQHDVANLGRLGTVINR